MGNFRKTYAVGVPFSQLKSFLAVPAEDQGKVQQSGIPVLDTLSNEMVWWIQASKQAFRNAGRPLKYLIKGDGNAKYPTFEAVVSALKKNDEFKYNLVTSLEGAPKGTELDIQRSSGNKSN
jgi:biopolymer transport protein ExbD